MRVYTVGSVLGPAARNLSLFSARRYNRPLKGRPYAFPDGSCLGFALCSPDALPERASPRAQRRGGRFGPFLDFVQAGSRGQSQSRRRTIAFLPVRTSTA